MLQHNDVAELVKNTYKSDQAINILMDFERVLDSLDIYTFRNWRWGELCAGPISKRYWVQCKFFWPEKLMPDPSGARRLLDAGIKIKYSRDVFHYPVRIRSANDYRPGTREAKMKEIPVWILDIMVPKSLIKDVFMGQIEVDGDIIDFQELDKTYDDNLTQSSMEDDTQGDGSTGATDENPQPQDQGDDQLGQL